MIERGKLKESETRKFREEFYLNAECRFGKVTFEELKELANHPHEVQNRIKSLRERLEICPDIRPDFPCFFYLMNSQDQIVCSIKALPDTLWTGSKKYPWAWMGALLTDEAHRGKGLATMIANWSRKILHQHDIAWGGVFSTDEALRIYNKLGFCLPGYASRYLMIKSLRPFLKAHIKSRLTIYILDRISKPIFRLIYQFCSRGNHREDSDVKLAKLDVKDLDMIQFPEVYYKTKYHFNNSLEKLGWKVEGSNAKTENDCSLYLLNELKTGKPICYLVIRLKLQLEPLADKYRDFKLMTLMDFGLFQNDERIYATLCQQVINLFWKSDAEVLEIISNEKGLIKILTQRGLIKVGKGMSYTFSVPEGWHLGNESNELSNWNLTSFCGDGFSF